jgi:tetratricopeptide (TPR) repeat protein
MYSAGKGLNDKSASEEHAYDSAIRAAEELQKRGLASAIQAEQLSWVLFGKATILVSRGDFAGANALLDEVVNQYGNSPEVEVRVRAASSMYDQAIYLGNSNLWEKAVSYCKEIVARFAGEPEPELQEVAAWAMAHEVDALRALSEKAQALEVCDEAVLRFECKAEPPIQAAVAYVMVNKGSILASNGLLLKAIEMYDEVVRRWDGSTDAALLRQVARAMLNKALKLRSQAPTEAARVCTEIAGRYGGSNDPLMENYVRDARSMLDQLQSNSEGPYRGAE